jgi:hypothetical protein
MASELRFEEAAAIRDRILELQGQTRPPGLPGLRPAKRRGPHASPSKSMRGMEAPAPFSSRAKRKNRDPSSGQ